MRNLKILLSWLLLAGGSFFIYSGLRDYWESRSSQSQAERSWKEEREVERPAEVSARHRAASSATTPHIRAGDSFARLSIPRLHTVLYVVEGTSHSDLRRGPGHLEGTAFPGTTGNCVIAGHRDTHFRPLKDIRKGDEIDLDTAAGQYRYRVSEMSIVSPRNTESLNPTPTPVLNLVTCYPFWYVGSAPKRFVVRADLVRKQAAAVNHGVPRS
jgi:sortase A